MVTIRLVEVLKKFREVTAVDNVSLVAEQGKLFSLLGPSGCGKTTTLRILAGFEFPDKGRVLFDSKDVTFLSPNKRETGMVFQNYALWPHMTIRDNIAYGLKLRKFGKNEIEKRLRWVAELLRLQGLENRYPSQISGGQQQRVALARALAIQPKTLLLDEPLSNLDAKLRIETRAEVRRLQRSLGITTIYVTHDQEEAMSISDEIAVMNKGSVQQVGAPREIYERPGNEFVADFIGQSTFIGGEVKQVDGLVAVDTPVGAILGINSRPETPISAGDKVIVSIRPENLSTSARSDKFNVLPCSVSHVAYLGKSQRVYGEAEGIGVLAELPSDIELSPGEKIKLYAKPEETVIIPAK